VEVRSVAQRFVAAEAMRDVAHRIVAAYGMNLCLRLS
jgi:hypothetical protein